MHCLACFQFVQFLCQLELFYAFLSFWLIILSHFHKVQWLIQVPMVIQFAVRILKGCIHRPNCRYIKYPKKIPSFPYELSWKFFVYLQTFNKSVASSDYFPIIDYENYQSLYSLFYFYFRNISDVEHCGFLARQCGADAGQMSTTCRAKRPPGKERGKGINFSLVFF